MPFCLILSDHTRPAPIALGFYSSITVLEADHKSPTVAAIPSNRRPIILSCHSDLTPCFERSIRGTSIESCQFGGIVHRDQGRISEEEWHMHRHGFTLFAFHPSVCLLKEKIMIDGIADRTGYIVTLHSIILHINDNQ